MTRLLPLGQIAPVVTFFWSEHEAIKDNQKMSLLEANNLMKDLDSKVVLLKQEAQEKGDYYPYFKTKFQIEYVMNGEKHTYEGRQDIGDGDGSLIDHVKLSSSFSSLKLQYSNLLISIVNTFFWSSPTTREFLLKALISLLNFLNVSSVATLNSTLYPPQKSLVSSATFKRRGKGFAGDYRG